MNRTGRRKRLSLLYLMLAAAAVIICGVCVNGAVRVLYPMKYNDIIESSCEEFGVDRALVYAVIKTESGFDPEACSEVGARGLMQIMPGTFLWLQNRLASGHEISIDELYRPDVNIRYGVYYLSLLQEQFGSETLVIAAYHAGQGSVSTWLDTSGLSFEAFTAENIPSAATRHYVAKVSRAVEVYNRVYF